MAQWENALETLMFSLEVAATSEDPEDHDLLIAELWAAGSAGIAELDGGRLRAFFEDHADRDALLDTAGLITRETSFAHLEHAASCAACAEELQHAMFAVDDSSPIPEEIQRQMATVTKDWQRRFAEQLAAEKIPTSGKLRKALSRTWKKVTRTKKPRPGNEGE